MSNDQPHISHYLPPVILVVSGQDDQQDRALQFIQDQLGWADLKKTELSWLNETGENIAIAEIRSLIGELAYAGHLGRNRAFILLHAENITAPAQNALLKSLEEPPVKTQLMLVTHHPERLLPTITSRCLIQYLTNDVLEPIKLEELPPTLQQLLNQPATAPTYAELIHLAAEYKDREAALQLIQQAMHWVHSQLSAAQPNHSLEQQRQLLATFNQLQANANVALALENCFFQLKNQSS